MKLRSGSTKQDILLFIGILIVGILFLIVSVYFNGKGDLENAGVALPNSSRCPIDQSC